MARRRDRAALQRQGPARDQDPFVIGLLLLKHIFALSDEEVCERWVYDPYFQYFTGEEFFQHAFPHERSDLSHWRKRLGDKLELLLAESLRVAHEAGALRTTTSSGSRSTPRCSPRPSPSRPTPSYCMRRSRGSIAWPAGIGCSCGSHICASPSARR